MLTKQSIDISFSQGVDTKTDPKRVQIGKFSRLVNTVFSKGGRLQKRNGYPELSQLPDTTYSYLTTFNGNLTALGPTIAAYSSGNERWVAKGSITPISLTTLPLIRNNLNQTAVDSAIAPNGLVCTVYLETDGTTTTNKYAIANSITGQNIVAPTAIPPTTGAVSGGMRVFVLGSNFIITFKNTISAVKHLQYISISSQNPSVIAVTNTDISANFIESTTPGWDGVVVGNTLYIAFAKSSGGTGTYMSSISSANPAPTTPVKVINVGAVPLFSVAADVSNPVSPVIYVSIFKAGDAYVAAVDQNINILVPEIFFYASGDAWTNLTSAAQDGYVKIFGEVTNAYTTGTGLPSNYITSFTITPLGTSFTSVFSNGASTVTVSSATGLVNGMFLGDITTSGNLDPGTTFTVSGTTLTLNTNTTGSSASSPGDRLTASTVSGQSTIIRSLGLASKAFIVDGTIYFLGAYQSSYQPSYFLIDGSKSLESSPVIAAKLAYQNGGGYLTSGLPSVSINQSSASISYRFKDLIQAVNKDTNVASGTQTAGIYSQTGLNLVTLTFSASKLDTAEIGSNLHSSGGYLGMYDGYLPVEHNFFLWPDIIDSDPTLTAVWSSSGGAMHAQPNGSTNTDAYFYQVTYEWTDNQGNAFRSAPSIPVSVTTSSTGTTGSITLKLATLRLTAKTANPVKIVIYRWSAGQQIYYQVTSISSPTLNSTTADQITFVDTLADSSILGNNIIYTNGGVIEDVNAPASNALALFDTRLWMIDAEDPNLLWYSKQVIEATPVEMSDLLTLYIPPTVGTATGRATSIAPMDDKLIISKGGNSFVYINGSGPDNTGSNNQYSQPIFVNSTVGCSNQKSIAIIPRGMMFESNKGIWLLDRGLDTEYIGAPVEDFTTGAHVASAVTVPETNQVRFTLDTGITLTYDYFYDQWSVFEGVPCVSSCIFEGLHTFINASGLVFQEKEGHYLDGSNPVLISFKTGPIRLGELQNYQRAYFFYLLGDYLSPHKLLVNIYYDYSPNPSGYTLISPTNYAPNYGAEDSSSPFGQGSPYGGPSRLEDWRIFLERQRCMAFAISIDEIYDPSFGAPAGAGFTLSGLNVICGLKSPFRPQAATNSAGTK